MADHIRAAAVPGVTPLTRIDAIKMNTTTFQGGSIVSLLFLNGSADPAYVLRVPRDPTRPERVLANYQALRTLEDIQALERTVPRPVHLGEHAGVCLTLETCVHGFSMLARIQESADTAAVLDEAVEWVWRLHSTTRTGEPQCLRLNQPMIALLAAHNLLAPRAQRRLDDAVHQIEGKSPFISLRHGDFNPNNVLLSEAGPVAGVVDWEYAAVDLAMFDVISMFRLGWMHPDSPGSVHHGIDGLLSGHTPLALSFRRAADRYTSPDNLRALFYVYIARMVADYVRATGDTGAGELRVWIEYLNGFP